jgi:hypothetical protein
MKMGGVYLGTDDDGAQVQFDAGGDEIVEFFLPKAQVMRLIALLNFQLRRNGWSSSEERCYHYFARDRCRKPRVAGRSFCQQHANQFKNRSNQDLLESAAELFEKVIGLNDQGKLAFTGDFRAYEDFTNHLSELGSRGYGQDDLTKAIGLFLKEREGLFASGDPKWRRFEKLAFGVYLLRAEGAEITFDEKIVGRRTGRKRQADICIRFKKQFSEYLAVVECKDERVSIDEVEALSKKQDDMGADRLIVLSARGFQQGALEAAKAYGIDAHELTEERLDWTTAIKTHRHELPFPRNIHFDMPSLPAAGDVNSGYMKFSELEFHDAVCGGIFTLADVIRDVCVWAHKTALTLPCQVDVRFDDATSFRPPNHPVQVPVYGLTLQLERMRIETSRTIDFPPHVVRYKYTDSKTGLVEEIEPTDVENALRQRARSH